MNGFFYLISNNNFKKKKTSAITLKVVLRSLRENENIENKVRTRSVEGETFSQTFRQEERKQSYSRAKGYYPGPCIIPKSKYPNSGDSRNFFRTAASRFQIVLCRQTSRPTVTSGVIQKCVCVGGVGGWVSRQKQKPIQTGLLK